MPFAARNRFTALRDRNRVVQNFVREQRATLLKHARTYTRAGAIGVSAEDIAREMELIMAQVAQEKGVAPADFVSFDAYVKSIVAHAANRAKRRRTLIEQISAGDDLQAISDDLAVLDSDLPEKPTPPNEAAQRAFANLQQLKAALSPREALIGALLFEDRFESDEVAALLSIPEAEVALALEKIEQEAEKLGMTTRSSTRTEASR